MRKKEFKILLTILLLILTVFIPASYAGKVKTVAVLPFKINAAQDLTFLKEGIMDMLSSRLSWKDKVIVVEKELVKEKVAELKGRVNKETALKIGEALKADYVILGSLTVFGNSVSLDVKIMDVAKEKELITAFDQSKGMDEVIPTVNKFAQDINAKIMGRYVRAPVQAAAPEPEALKGPSGLVAAREDFEGKQVGHVQAFAAEIVGLDVGDVDGDGKNELVLVDKKKVYIYKWREKTFAQFKAVKEGWSPNYVYVSVGDLDGNGRAEIYVSNLGESDVSSFVLEWDGSRFKKIADGQPWFFRVLDFSGEGPTLIGQRREAGGDFHGPVQFLKKEGKGFSSTGSVSLPRSGNVYNFALANFVGTGKTYTVLLDPDGYLLLYDSGGEKVWRSEEYYGGTTTYMQGGGGTEMIFYFMPSPIYITDVDEDGKKEVMVCKNVSKTRRLFDRLRYFSSGTVEFLTWNRLGLSTKWTTRKQTGPIVGYRVFDVDNDGLQELVAVSVIKGETITRKGRSQLVVYDLK